MVEVRGLESLEVDAHVTLSAGITFEQLNCVVENPTESGDKRGKLIYTYEGQPVGAFLFVVV